MMASEISPSSKAFRSALVSITSPREVLIMTGQRFNDRKKVWSAKWNVLYGPSLYKGTWKVRISHSGCECFQGTEIALLLPCLAGAGHSSGHACPVLALLGYFATHIAYADDA